MNQRSGGEGGDSSDQERDADQRLADGEGEDDGRHDARSGQHEPDPADERLPRGKPALAMCFGVEKGAQLILIRPRGSERTRREGGLDCLLERSERIGVAMADLSVGDVQMTASDEIEDRAGEVEFAARPGAATQHAGTDEQVEH